ncbi:hypothetical protein MKX01_015526 [Papaver californicum]|nr:hypothetical protein MKX01_015526 [Papaver californicum]
MDLQGANSNQRFKPDRSNMGRYNEDADKVKVVHLFTSLSENFRSQLIFPEKFVRKCLRKELSNISTVSLRGPSGRTWSVELMRNGSNADEMLCLGKGWEVFVKEHSLKEGDVLFLKYKLGGSVFDVLMFDDENFCEKESSYFVGNCKNEGCHRSNGLNERKKEPSTEPKRLRNKVKGKQITISDDEMEDSCSKTSRLSGSKGNAPAFVKREEDSEEKEVNPMALVLKKGPLKEKCTSFRQAARGGIRSGKPHFVVVVKSTHVANIYAMTVPIKFSSKHVPVGTKIASLKVDGKTWPVEYASFGTGKSSGFRGCGWRDFVRGNKLSVEDVCLFEATSSSSSKSTRKSIILNVTIFRN